MYDMIAVGFGPANLALTVSFHESNVQEKLLCLEKKDYFVWHPGMLLDDVTIQTPFLKDLVTSHNPTSHFTFLNFLKEKDRLFDSISLREFFPSRIEFNEYFSWAADKLKKYVLYSTTVKRIELDKPDKDGYVNHLKILAKDASGNETEYLAKNIVIGMGSVPYIPESCQINDDRLFHSSELTFKLASQYADKTKNYRFTVVGAGQSAAEVCLYLLNNYPNSHVTVASRGFIFHSLDESALVNKLYGRPGANYFYHLKDHAKTTLLNSLGRSNFSAVDKKIIDAIAAVVYKSRVKGEERVTFLPYHKATSVNISENGLVLESLDTMEEKKVLITSDAICFATGYSDTHVSSLVSEISDVFIPGDRSMFEVDASYRIKTKEKFKPGIYLQGYSKETHGFTEGTIADLAGRSHVILTDIINRREA